MEPSLVLLLIAICCVVVIDLSGFIDALKQWIWKFAFKGKREYQYFSLKPFDCALCASWWINLGYLIISGNWNLPLMTLALVIAFLTPIIKDTILTLKAFLQKIIDTIYWYFNLDN